MKLTAKTREIIIESIKRGNTISHVCDLAGINRRTFYHRMKRDPKLAREVRSAKLHAREFVDTAYQKLIRAGKERTIIHAMDRLDRIDKKHCFIDALVIAQQKAIQSQDWELVEAIQHQIECEQNRTNDDAEENNE